MSKSESDQNIFLCVLRLENGHLTSSPAVTLAVGNIATLSSQAAYYIKNTRKISFLPEDMQEHDVKLAVRKTEVQTDNFFYQLQTKAADHSTALVQGAQVSETFRAHFLAIPPKTPATISEPEALPVDGPAMALSADSECCVLALVKCKETIQTNKPTSPKTKKTKDTHSPATKPKVLFM